MKEFFDKVKNADIGSIVPIYKEYNLSIDPIEFFSKLTDYGRRKNCIMLESADIMKKYGELSVGSADPCLILRGRGETFEIKALNKLGKKVLKFLKGDFDFCDEVTYSKDSIVGVLKPKREQVSEEERMRLKTHIDIIRAVAFKFKAMEVPFLSYGGLFGNISYDLIDQFEDLPKKQKELFHEEDYEMYFLDNLFMMNHEEGKTYFVSNALVMDDDREKVFTDCVKKIEEYEKVLNDDLPKPREYGKVRKEVVTDTPRSEFEKIVLKLKKNILKGDVFQVVPSRTIVTNYNCEPLDVYTKLKKLNPSPYMFYMHSDTGILLGSSPEVAVRVQDGIVEMRPIAGTKPRGKIKDEIDPDLDSRYEAELKIDRKELSEHTMLIDLARNDIAKISVAGTRFVDEPFVVEKYSHVQHLVSNVRGELKKELDCLHAYLATMNMGTLTGAPKVEAMKLIRGVEKNRRGFYGGSVGFITPSKDMETCIAIRTMKIVDDKAYIRAGAGIVYDSIPSSEFDETEKKAGACVDAIIECGGIR